MDCGWSSCCDNVDGCTEIQYAAYTLQLYLLSKCAKLVEKMNIHKLSDGGHLSSCKTRILCNSRGSKSA